MGQNFVQQNFLHTAVHYALYISVSHRKILNKVENSAHVTPTNSAKLVSFPDPTLKEGRGSGDIEEFSWSCAQSPAPIIQIYANSLMTAELVELRIENVTRHFPLHAWLGLGTRLP